MNFLEFAHERQNIWHKRQRGEPAPWTTDPVLHKFRFTNIFRELDATTVWFTENVRDRLAEREEVFLATVVFRLFNRITTGEAIFCQTTTAAGTAWENLLVKGVAGLTDMKHDIKNYCGKGPYVTGAYIINSPNGMDKLTGVLWMIEQVMSRGAVWRHERGQTVEGTVSQLAELCCKPGTTATLESVWNWIRQHPHIADFTAYEIVTDLRHTCILRDAPDIYTWANPGPGAMRGLNRIHGRDLNRNQQKEVFVQEMRDLLEKYEHDWPKNPTGLPVEMRDIEHSLCEYDKYLRATNGEGRPRGVYPHGR